MTSCMGDFGLLPLTGYWHSPGQPRQCHPIDNAEEIVLV
jgi:hypothetical protein